MPKNKKSLDSQLTLKDIQINLAELRYTVSKAMSQGVKTMSAYDLVILMRDIYRKLED